MYCPPVSALSTVGIQNRQGDWRGSERPLVRTRSEGFLIKAAPLTAPMTNEYAHTSITMRQEFALLSACERRFSLPTTRAGARRALRSARRNQPHRAAGTGAISAAPRVADLAYTVNTLHSCQSRAICEVTA